VLVQFGMLEPVLNSENTLRDEAITRTHHLAERPFNRLCPQVKAGFAVDQSHVHAELHSIAPDAGLERVRRPVANASLRRLQARSEPSDPEL
jgi:hypothetical protein